ncbi:MAG TPA: zinc-dependent alcohol dehydrogenase family protein [Acidobacteriaceae bacterium]|nr:zinc-dependent alcohol dehydrogenase family protein [Acidobacteriaceae bacterium]
MPKVFRFYEQGGPEKLKLENEPSREPGEGEVKLRVEATGLNRAEALYMRGFYLEQAKLPSRIGYEAAGVVEAVGPGADTKWIGKRVATIPGYSQNQYGVLGEEAIVPVSSLGEYPAKLSAVEGAAIWMQYMTAWGALVHYGHVDAGDAVVIPAASSSVGLAAIQIVKDAGGVAIAATRTSKKKDDLLDLGADAVIATEEEDLPARVKEITGGKGARVIFDPVAGPAIEKMAEAAAPGGIIFEYGGLSMQPTPFPLFPALRKGLTLRGYTLHEIRADSAVLREAQAYIYERLENGRFVPKIAKTFPLAQAVEAYQYLESNEQVGKVVITV